MQNSNSLRQEIINNHNAIAAKYGEAAYPPGGRMSGGVAPAPLVQSGQGPQGYGQELAQETLIPPAWQHWQALFLQLPEQAQAIIIEREMTLSDYEELDELMKRQDDLLQSLGKTRVQGLRELLDIHEMTRTDPHGYIQHFARHVGLDLQALVQGQAHGQAQQGVSPAAPAYAGERSPQLGGDAAAAYGVQGAGVAPLPNPEHAMARQVMQQLEQMEARMAWMERRADAHKLERQWEAFRDEVDASGQPKRPFCTLLEGEMAQQLQQGKPFDLPALYAEALANHPELQMRSETVAQPVQESEQQRRARAAARANKMVSGSLGAAQAEGSAQNRTLREEIIHNMKRLGYM
ncbi:hypothetical protein [Magnetococcus marinus]|nr:hypothetical protein [Magnetococcus marinus]